MPHLWRVKRHAIALLALFFRRESFAEWKQQRDLRFFGRERREHCRQFHSKNRAALLRIVAKNLPRVLLYDAKTNAQAKPGAFAHRFRGVKGIEYAFVDP